MSNVNNRLKSFLNPQVFSTNSDREKGAEARKTQKMGDAWERDPVSKSPPSGNTDENTVRLTSAGPDVSALTQRQKYVCKTKASEAEREQADSISFTSWTVTLDSNP